MTAASSSVADLIAAECDAVKAMLLAKNAAYGNSALDPVRVFSRADAGEQIRVRLDDKLSRLARGSGQETEDVEADIIGYLILLRVHRRLGEPVEKQRVRCASQTCCEVYVVGNGGCPRCGERKWRPWP